MAEEEILAVGRSNAADEKFDHTVGALEDIVMDDGFQDLQDTFMEKYYQEFEDTEENKLVYMDIFKEYTDMLEQHIEQHLTEKIPSFSMDEFQKNIMSRRDQIDLEIFDMLQTMSDFLEFKQMFLNYKAMKEGKMVDLSQGIVVKHFESSDDTDINMDSNIDITTQFHSA
ncbi:ADP-ribosylation factor-like protein 2-binding protein [Rhopilema esculentum]|uniref:ADP-ribosylation factor-like protein 2-binding protein n=1 Tax=Rhopilema esculentum TaxID=499914 RepID=UPI0031D8D387|eukprot:gene1075-15410_t